MTVQIRISRWRIGLQRPGARPFEAIHFTYVTHVRCFPKDSDGESSAADEVVRLSNAPMSLSLLREPATPFSRERHAIDPQFAANRCWSVSPLSRKPW